MFFFIIGFLFVGYLERSKIILIRKGLESNRQSTPSGRKDHLNTAWGGPNYDFGIDVAMDSLGKIYVTGSTYSFGAGICDVFVAQYDNSGNLIWDALWGGNSLDEAYAIALDDSNNIYITGVTMSFGGGSEDPFLLCFNRLGSLVWNTTFREYKSAFGLDIAVDRFNKIYITGVTDGKIPYENDAFLVQYDKMGIQQWNTTWGGDKHEAGTGVAVDDSGNVYMTGFTYGFNTQRGDMLLVKYDNLGIQQWNITWGGDDYDWGLDIAIDRYNNIYVTGRTTSFGVGDYDLFLTCFNSAGSLIWNTTWGGKADDEGWDIMVDDFGIIYVTGYTESFGAGELDVFLTCFNSAGSLIWNTTWGGKANDEGRGVIVDDSNNIYVTGKTESFDVAQQNAFLGRFDKYGELIWINYGNSSENIKISIPNEILPTFLTNTAVFGVIFTVLSLLVYYRGKKMEIIHKN
ncbi:MAG: SBBP repeat-containing protein [Candidatus Lokiarchaeota archaeon]